MESFGTFQKLTRSDKFHTPVLYNEMKNDLFTFSADHNVIWWDPEGPVPPTVPEDRRLVKGEFKDLVTDGKQTFEMFAWKTLLLSHTSTSFQLYTLPTFNTDGTLKTFGLIHTLVLAP